MIDPSWPISTMYETFDEHGLRSKTPIKLPLDRSLATIYSTHQKIVWFLSAGLHQKASTLHARNGQRRFARLHLNPYRLREDDRLGFFVHRFAQQVFLAVYEDLIGTRSDRIWSRSLGFDLLSSWMQQGGILTSCKDVWESHVFFSTLLGSKNLSPH